MQLSNWVFGLLNNLLAVPRCPKIQNDESKENVISPSLWEGFIIAESARPINRYWGMALKFVQGYPGQPYVQQPLRDVTKPLKIMVAPHNQTKYQRRGNRPFGGLIPENN